MMVRDAATATAVAPLLQYVERPGIVDLAWGHPDPTLLPLAELRDAAQQVFDRYGADAVAYGHPAGAGPLIDWIHDRLAVVDTRAPDRSEILITAGTSAALDQIATMLTTPGDTVLVESPTYHLAVRILRDHPINLVAVPSDDRGLSVDRLAEAAHRLKRNGAPARLLYCVPTYNNPTGTSLDTARRAQLVDVAAREGIIIVEDDAYRELSFEGTPPPSLWSLDTHGVVVRLGSFSKSIAPGLRVGYLTASVGIVEQFASGGMLDSGGGNSHFAALMVATYASNGSFVATVQRFRAEYKARRDALLAPFAEARLDRVQWTTPRGGYFAWLTFGDDVDAEALRYRAEALGTSFALGVSFYLDRDRGRNAARVAYTRFDAATLRRAGELIVEAARGV
jgi:DNA-binding transcriptional MocR family regulator